MKKVITIIGSIILIYLIALVVVTGSYQKNVHQEPYAKDYYSHYTDPRKRLVSLALQAPSSHNMQPWRIILDEENTTKMYLYINPERVLPEVDANYNQMVISSGTFIAYAMEAGEELGYDVNYELFPNGELPSNPSKEELESTLIAVIDVIPRGVEAIPNVDTFTGATIKGNYTEETIDSKVLDELKKYQESKITIQVLNQNIEEIKEKLIEGIRIESQTENIMKETASIFRYTKIEKNQNKFGLSMNTSFSSKMMLANIEFINQLFPLSWEKEGQIWLDNEIKNINSCQVFGVIYGDDSRLSQLQAGIALGHMYYDLKDNNISVQPIVQLTETYDEIQTLTSEFRQTYANGQDIHVIFRLGYVDNKNMKTMRLTVEDLVK